MAVVTICSDFGAQKNKVSHCFHCFPHLFGMSEVKWSEVAQLCLTLCNPMDTRLLGPWDFLGKSTGVGCNFLLQVIFPTQGSNPGLPHCIQTLYRLSHQGSLGEVTSTLITSDDYYVCVQGRGCGCVCWEYLRSTLLVVFRYAVQYCYL